MQTPLYGAGIEPTMWAFHCEIKHATPLPPRDTLSSAFVRATLNINGGDFRRAKKWVKSGAYYPENSKSIKIAIPTQTPL